MRSESRQVQVRAKDFRMPGLAVVKFDGDAGKNTMHDGRASTFEELAVNDAGAGGLDNDVEAVPQLLDDDFDRLGPVAAAQNGEVATCHGRRGSLKISA